MASDFNEDGGLGVELRQAAYVARLRGGPAAIDARQALRMATMGGARCLGREAEIGSIEPGKLADLALWDLTGIEHAGILDPVAALVFGALPPLAALFVGGHPVVEDDLLCKAAEDDIATDLAGASTRLARKAGLIG
ncbi:hypothetical protein GCM10023148_17790 [Actinokineospora soli]